MFSFWIEIFNGQTENLKNKLENDFSVFHFNNFENGFYHLFLAWIYYHETEINIFRSAKNNIVAMVFHNYKKFPIEEYWRVGRNQLSYLPGLSI